MVSKADENVFLAKLAEQAERYEEMVTFMKAVVHAREPGEPLNLEERNLLSVAYKNVVGMRRTSLRAIVSKERNEAARAEAASAKPANLVLLATYRTTIETELETICSDVHDLIKTRLLDDNSPDTTNDVAESQIFYLTMCAD